MKKKGLIISTVVMVVVLIASLTTATYAWFSVSSVTKIGEFNVSVVSDNAVNVGIKQNYTTVTDAAGVNSDAFYTGDVTFETGTPGSMTLPGTWTSAKPGLSAVLNPNINWGSQNRAVGVSTDGSTFTKDNTGLWTKEQGQTVVAANTGLDGKGWNVEKAYANIGKDENSAGNYVHFILGVSPTAKLKINKFVVMVEPTSGTSLGVLASIHVAYRVTRYKATTVGAFTDVDVYPQETFTGNTPINATFATNVKDGLLTAYQKTYENATPKYGSYACVIEGLDLEKDAITQIELVVYLAGTDPDCNDQGKTSGGNIKMFFQTEKEATPQG